MKNTTKGTIPSTKGRFFMPFCAKSVSHGDYYHTMPNHKALVDWVKGTRLRPYLDYLGENRAAEFEKELVERSKNIYSVMDNGNVVLGFRRLFFTAVK